MDIPHFIYLFICWWTCGLFPLCLNTWFSFLWGRYLKVELLGHVVILCLTYWGTTELFSTAAAPFYIPTGNVGLVCILANIYLLVLLLLFSYSHPSEGEFLVVGILELSHDASLNVQADLVLLSFTLLRFADAVIFFFLQMKGYGNPAWNKSVGSIFPTAFAHSWLCVSFL